MGTHSDGKPVTVGGFGGAYWYAKAMREKEEARKARIIEQRRDAAASELGWNED